MTIMQSPLPTEAFPSSFAMVMATGIVSMALHLLGHDVAARALFALNLAAYALLWAAGAWRVARRGHDVLTELADHVRGPQFLTIVAATNVLGVQCARLTQWNTAAAVLWIFGVAVWALLIYGFFAMVTVSSTKPTLQQGLGGSWLLVTVSTESVSLLGTLVAPQFARPDGVLFASLAFFLAGGMLYILVIALMFFRWMFLPMHAHTLTPPSWINMGAVAITSLAGARLLEAAPGDSFVAGIAPFLGGFTLFFWATATWWILLLVLVFSWRRLQQRTPVHYDPQYLSMVFPLGTYSVATWIYAESARLLFLLPLARAFGYVAAATWVLTLVGMLHRTSRRGFAYRSP
ncbi:MAG: tellurite resistance/C4-dicarboxylate transporter family protein [Casimicrobiaceae bacterium]